MDFDPFSSGAATEIMDKPTGFDPFSTGQATAVASTPEPEKNSAPDVGTDWNVLYAGINREWDAALSPTQRAVFQRLDTVSDNSNDARMQAVNQAYLSTQVKNLSHATIERNWPAVRDAYANNVLGIPGEGITDTKLYSEIAKQRFNAAMAKGDNSPEAKAARSWQSADWTEPKATQNFWEALNEPFFDLPEAPKDLPNFPQMGMQNPALAGAAWNGIKSLIEGLETPLGVATVGVGSGLKALGATYPVAKVALVGMTGIFTGMMGWQTGKAVIEVPGVLNDPNASFQDKATAVITALADAGATLLGAVGVAMEMFPKKATPKIRGGGHDGYRENKPEFTESEISKTTQESLLKELEGKNPAEAAQIFRREAVETDIPTHSDFLNDAARELDKIATVKDREAVKVDIGKRDETVSTGTGVATPHEEAMMAEWRKQIAEEQKASKPTELVGIKNDAIDAELKAMGERPATHGEKIQTEQVLTDAAEKLKADPLAGQKLINEIIEKPRTLEAKEDALAVSEMNRLRLNRDAAEKAFNEATTPEAKESARLLVAQTRDEFMRASDAVTVAGTKWGQGGVFRRLMMKEDYSLAAIERRRVVANEGKPLTESQQKEVRDLHRQLTEAQKRIDVYEAQRAAAGAAPIKEAPVRRPPTGKARQFLADQAQQARERIKTRLSSGRVSSGIDPLDLADYAIVGADYIANGVGKFSDWSVAMVNELGETIRPHLQEIFKQAIKARDDGVKLQAYKARLATETTKLGEKLAAGDTARPERKTLKLDSEAIRLKTEYERIKRKVDLSILAAEMQARSWPQKLRGAFQGFVRFGALSWPTVFEKLTAAAIARVVSTPLEQLVGLVASKLLPQLAERARMEGVPTVGGMVRAESKAFVEGITTGMKGAADMLRNKESDLTALLEKEQFPPGLVDYLGKLHGAFKEPAKTADFARRLQLITESDIRKGIDVTQPVEQLRLMHEAWAYAKRSIFMQDNGVVNVYKAAIRSLEAKQKATGKPSAALQLISSFAQAELPIIKVPTNVVAEIMEALTGLLQGPARAAWAYAKGIENLNAAEADTIMRLIKKGSIGSAFLLLGWFKYESMGGFYQQGEKRTPKEVHEGEIRTGVGDLPKNLLHNTYAEVAQYGATVHRVADELVKKSGGEQKGPLAGIVGATVGLFNEVPFVRETTILGRYADSRQVLSAMDAKAASILVPGIVQWTAAQLDKEQPFSPLEKAHARKPTNLVESIKKGIPILREDVPGGKDVKLRQ